MTSRLRLPLMARALRRDRQATGQQNRAIRSEIRLNENPKGSSFIPISDLILVGREYERS
jgi:hypothetical protein